MKLDILSRKWVIVLLHIAFWLLLYTLPFLLRPSYDNQASENRARESGAILFYIINNLLWIGFST
jgi:hypothetical protein